MAGLIPKRGLTLSKYGVGNWHLIQSGEKGGFFFLTCHTSSETGWDFSALYRISVYNGSVLCSVVTVFGTSYNVASLSITTSIGADGLAHVYATKPTYWSYFSVTPLSAEVYANIYPVD